MCFSTDLSREQHPLWKGGSRPHTAPMGACDTLLLSGTPPTEEAHQPPQAAAGERQCPLSLPTPIQRRLPLTWEGPCRKSPHEPDIHSIGQTQWQHLQAPGPGSLSAQRSPQEGLPDSETRTALRPPSGQRCQVMEPLTASFGTKLPSVDKTRNSAAESQRHTTQEAEQFYYCERHGQALGSVHQMNYFRVSFVSDNKSWGLFSEQNRLSRSPISYSHCEPTWHTLPTLLTNVTLSTQSCGW